MGRDLLRLASPSQVASALEKTSRWYDLYRQWRDYAEFTAHGLKPARPTTEAPGENDLAKVANRPQYTGPAAWPIWRQETLVEAGMFNLLRCTYDRRSASPAQSSGNATHYFWNGTTVMTRGETEIALTANRNHRSRWLMRYELGDAALSECPANEEAALWISGYREPDSMAGAWNFRRKAPSGRSKSGSCSVRSMVRSVQSAPNGRRSAPATGGPPTSI